MKATANFEIQHQEMWYENSETVLVNYHCYSSTMMCLQLLSWGVWLGQVENAEVLKPNYGNGSTETEVRKWEEKTPISV